MIGRMREMGIGRIGICEKGEERGVREVKG